MKAQGVAEDCGGGSGPKSVRIRVYVYLTGTCTDLFNNTQGLTVFVFRSVGKSLLGSTAQPLLECQIIRRIYEIIDRRSK